MLLVSPIWQAPSIRFNFSLHRPKVGQSLFHSLQQQKRATKSSFCFFALYQKSKQKSESLFFYFFALFKERSLFLKSKFKWNTLLFVNIWYFCLLFKKSKIAIFSVALLKRATKSDCSFALYKKISKEQFALLLFTKRATKSNLLFRSFKKSDKEWFALLLFTKRAKEKTKERIAFSYFFPLFAKQ